MRSDVKMLKILKAKVLGGSMPSTLHTHDKAVIGPSALPKSASTLPTGGHAARSSVVPYDYDIIDIDSANSSAQSSTERGLPLDEPTVDVDKCFTMSYRSSVAAKEYTLVKTVNVGSTAKVQLAYHAATDRHVALKIMKKSKQHIKYMNREVSVHMQLNHPNIAALYDVIETPYHFVLAMEYLDGGDLFDLVPPNEGCPELQALLYLKQIVSAVSYMHAGGVVHRDIKPENCVSDRKGNLKLIDFGAASAADGPATPAGTIPYMAPELLRAGTREHTKSNWNLKAIDVWAVGIVYYTLLTGRFPFAVANEEKSPEFAEYLDGGVSGPIANRYPWFRINPHSLSLLGRMLCVDPTERATISEVAATIDGLMELALADQLKGAHLPSASPSPVSTTVSPILPSTESTVPPQPGRPACKAA